MKYLREAGWTDLIKQQSWNNVNHKFQWYRGIIQEQSRGKEIVRNGEWKMKEGLEDMEESVGP